MPKQKRRRGLEVPEDREFERASWTVQHYAWVAMLGFVLAGLAGYFGSGPLSDVRAEDPSGTFEMEYERRLRRQAPSAITIAIHKRPASGPLVIWFTEEHLRNFAVESIVPRPQVETSGSGMILYAFSSSPSHGTFSLTMEMRPKTIGRIQGSVGMQNGPTAEFAQFVFP